MSQTKTPTYDSTIIELLECIDDALRNGRLMTRANLAFDILLSQIGLTREDLPAYVTDIARINGES